MTGPYETERQAADAARHIYDSPPGTGAWGDGCHRLMEDACTAAGVTLGAYDHGILLWLAGWEPSTCAVIAGLISRSHLPELEEARGTLLGAAAILGPAQLATVLDALDVAAEYRVYRASLTCDACGTHPAELCEDHQADLDAAERYHAIAAQIGDGE